MENTKMFSCICNFCKANVLAKVYIKGVCGHNIVTSPAGIVDDTENWYLKQQKLEKNKTEFKKLEDERIENLKIIDSLKYELMQSQDIMKGMAELINHIELTSYYNSIKTQRLMNILKKIANSSNKHQTIQELDVNILLEQEPENSFNSICKILESIKETMTQEKVVIGNSHNVCSQLSENEQNLDNSKEKDGGIKFLETEQSDMLADTQNITVSLEENETQHVVDINKLQVEKLSINQPNSENLNNLNEFTSNQLNSSEQQKRFENFMNTADKCRALEKMKQMELKLRLDRIEADVQSLNRRMAPAEVYSKNSSEQQTRGLNQIGKIGENLMAKKYQLERFHRVKKITKKKPKQEKQFHL